MFYQKAAVMDTLVLKPCILRLYAPLRIHSSANVLLMVNIWNCQRQDTCVIKKWGNSNIF